jgi:hypothetical protein
LDIAAACRGQGVDFFPLGSWKLQASCKISSAVAVRKGADGEGLHAAFL